MPPLADSIARIRELADDIGRPVRFMEVCGTHTMSAFRAGLRSLLPSTVSLLSGPGCPVCVTPNSYLDHAMALAQEPGVVITSFGDMVRVPGTTQSLEGARARGADVRVVYSPLDALAIARKEPDRHIVFLGVGFETTTPTVAWTIKAAADEGIVNYSVLCAHKLIPPAMAILLESKDVQVDGFLCPGHVSVIIGAAAYQPLVDDYGAPCVVAGFEAADMAGGIRMLMEQLVSGKTAVEIEYTRSVDMGGNQAAQEICESTLEVVDTEWRGLGMLPGSGLKIREACAEQDAACRFPHIQVQPSEPDKGCRCGDVLRGAILPGECPLFAGRCTPMSPVGPCMVSSEGTCAAHYRYG